jgi:FtsP/CotA-like multicopper oxidase with cupredoxin domain
MLVVEERKPPAVDQEIEMLVDDWRLAEDGSLAPFGATPEAATGGRLGTWLTVGGEAVPRPIAALPGARLRVRLANASNARVMPLRFEGVRAYVAAIDSVPTDTFEPLRATLPFPPGRRYDLIVEMPGEGEAAGRILAAIGPGVPLATLTPTGKTVIGTRPPVTGIEERPSLPAEIRLQNATRRDLILGGGARRGPDGQVRYEGDPTRIWTVNGVAGTPGMPPLMKVARGTPVVSPSRTIRPPSRRSISTGMSSACCTTLMTAGSPIGSIRSRFPKGAPPASRSSPTIRASGSSARPCWSASILDCGPGSRSASGEHPA